MKKFKFILEEGAPSFICIARTFADACLLFDQCGHDPRLIIAIEER